MPTPALRHGCSSTASPRCLTREGKATSSDPSIHAIGPCPCDRAHAIGPMRSGPCESLGKAFPKATRRSLESIRGYQRPFPKPPEGH